MSVGKLYTVHDALQRAQDKAIPVSRKRSPGAYRVRKEVKDAADTICKSHGITLSNYVEECLELLVEDYQTPRLET